MSLEGWLFAIGLMAGSFLPVLGARTAKTKRQLMILATVSAAGIGVAAAWAALDPGSGVVYFPNTAGAVFMFFVTPLASGLPATGMLLMATKRTRLGHGGRGVLGTAAFIAAPVAYLYCSFRLSDDNRLGSVANKRVNPRARVSRHFAR